MTKYFRYIGSNYMDLTMGKVYSVTKDEYNYWLEDDKGFNRYIIASALWHQLGGWVDKFEEVFNFEDYAKAARSL